MKKKLTALAPLVISLFLMFIGCAERPTDNSDPAEGTSAESLSDGLEDSSSSAPFETDEAGNSVPAVTNPPETTIIVVSGDGTTQTIISFLTSPPDQSSETSSAAPPGTSVPENSGSGEGSVSSSSNPAAEETAPIIKLSEIAYPSFGKMFGSLSVDSIGVTLDLYMGDSMDVLRHGLGMNAGSSIPGAGGRMIIAGHNTSDMLRSLGDASAGDTITVKTSYGTFIYEIVSTKISSDTDASALATPSGEYMVLYTCYPFTSLFTSQRYYVWAKKISGPVLVK